MIQKLFYILLLLPIVVFSQTESITEDIDSTLFVSTTNEISQYRDPEYSTEQLQKKLFGYTRMHKAGRTLLGTGILSTSLGLASTVAGISLLVNNEPAGFIPYYIGAIGIAFGPEMIIAGAVLRKIGSKKQTEYENRLHVHIGINSIFLSYDF
jgi:hypothetical protein